MERRHSQRKRGKNGQGKRRRREEQSPRHCQADAGGRNARGKRGTLYEPDRRGNQTFAGNIYLLNNIIIYSYVKKEKLYSEGKIFV